MTEVDLNTKIRKFLNSAIKKLSVDDYNNAIQQLKAAEVLDKKNPEILYNLGICYSRLGLYKTSIEYFEKLLTLPFSFVENHTVKKLYAFALVHMDDYKGALKQIDDALNFYPNDTVAKSIKGYCFEKMGKFSKAIEEYKTIITIDKKNYNAYNSLAYLVCINNGKMNVALEYAKKAVESNDKNPAFLDTIGYIYLKMNKLKEAEKYLKIAIGFLPLSKEIREHYEELKALQRKQ